MASRYPRSAYGMTEALLGVAPSAIISNRNPTANDKGALGQQWINRTTNGFWVLTSVVGGASTWATGANAAANFATVGFLTVGNTLTVTAGGATITAGGLTVTAGGATITAGGLAVNGGNLDVAAGSIHAAVNCVVDADLEVVGGDATIDAGNIVVAIGNITATAGNIIATAGAITATAGDIEATAGDVTAGNDLIAGNDVSVDGGVVIDAAGGAPTITAGAGAPGGAPANGSIYINTAAAGHNDGLYIYTGGAWEVFTSA